MRYSKVVFLWVVLALLVNPVVFHAESSKPTPLQQLFIMKELIPGIKKVGLIWNKNEINEAELLPVFQRAATSAQLKLVIAEVEVMKDVSQQFRDLVSNRNIQALWIYSESEFFNNATISGYLIKKTVLNKIPLIAPNVNWINSGACLLITKENGKIKLCVNRKTSKMLNIQIPEKYQPSTQYFAAN